MQVGASCALGSGYCGTSCPSGTIFWGICGSGESCCSYSSGPPPGTQPTGTQPPPSGTITTPPVNGIYIPTPAETGLPGPQGGIAIILMNFLLWLIFIFGLLAMIALIVSGIQYLVSAGSEKMAETAKRNVTYSIIGIIVALSGYIIIQAIQSALSATPIF
jgi:hypothetical protein